MVTVNDLSVGTVSGMIAAAVTLGMFLKQILKSSLLNGASTVQIFIPLALPLILLGLLWEKNSSVTLTATTW